MAKTPEYRRQSEEQMPVPPTFISCTALSGTLLQKAKYLAKNLRLQFCLQEECTSEFVLTYTESRLELRHLPADGRPSLGKPLAVDFVAGAAGYRHLRDTSIRQPLAKAAGLKPGFRPVIFDATAGLGADAFVLASLGSRVILNERSPVIGALLADGLERAAVDRRAGPVVTERMHLMIGDAQETLPHLKEKIDTVYLDPMYPHEVKSALNKREMRMVRAVVGDDQDCNLLLSVSRCHATRRVVVKRPRSAPYLDNQPPDYSINMKSSRFDVYLTPHL